LTGIDLLTVDGRCVLRLERLLDPEPEKVWRAVTEPAAIGKWYPFPVAELDLRPGGTVGFDAGDGTTFGGVVTEVDPLRVFAFREEDDLLRLEISPAGDGSRLVLSHTFDDRPAAASNGTGWTTCLDLLEQVAAGQEPVEADSDPVALHEQLVVKFGLDKGTVRTTEDGWIVRFERQLRSPAADVWAELAGSTEPRVGDPVPAGFGHSKLAAGKVTEVETAEKLEFSADGGTVRYELRPGNGGARMTLVHDGTGDYELALSAWHDHIEALASRLLDK
jgi:uncharacterized protein YndB with AHSA1/START domain